MPGHRRVARRAAREDALLERVQGARPLVGRAAAVLDAAARRRRRARRRARRVLRWYFAATAPELSLVADVAVRRARAHPGGLRASSGSCCRCAGARWAASASRLAFAVLAVVACKLADLEAWSRTSRSSARRPLFAFWFLGFFEELALGRARRADRSRSSTRTRSGAGRRTTSSAERPRGVHGALVRVPAPGRAPGVPRLGADAACLATGRSTSTGRRACASRNDASRCATMERRTGMIGFARVPSSTSDR